MAQTAKEKRDAREKKLRDEGAAQARAEMGKPPGPSSEEIQAANARAILNPGAVPDAKGKVASPQPAGQKVIVACKLGVAYYDIQLCKIVEKFEQNLQGGRTINEANRIGEVVRLRGTSYPRGTPPKGFPPPPEIVNGAALNRGIDKDWFDEWLRQHAKDPIVINKFVFAHATDDGIRAESAELSKFLSGLEPINPAGDARIPKSSRPEEVLELEPGQRS